MRRVDQFICAFVRSKRRENFAAFSLLGGDAAQGQRILAHCADTRPQSRRIRDNAPLAAAASPSGDVKIRCTWLGIRQ